MRGACKHKVVSSGRLTGAGRGQAARRRVTGGQIPKTIQRPSAEPAYSLYSTDTEDQVSTIHNGLDRCAALLDCILQAEKTEAKPNPARVLKSGSAKPRTHSALGKECVAERKKATRKAVARTAPPQKSLPSSGSKVGLGVGRRCFSPPVQSVEAEVQCGAPSASIRTQVQSNGLDTDRGENPQSSQCEPAPCVLFDHHLTSSTPTLSPENLASSPAHTSPSGFPAQSHCLSAGVDGPEEVPFPLHSDAPAPQNSGVLSLAPCSCTISLCELHSLPGSPCFPPSVPLSHTHPFPGTLSQTHGNASPSQTLTRHLTAPVPHPKDGQSVSQSLQLPRSLPLPLPSTQTQRLSEVHYVHTQSLPLSRGTNLSKSSRPNSLSAVAQSESSKVDPNMPQSNGSGPLGNRWSSTLNPMSSSGQGPGDREGAPGARVEEEEREPVKDVSPLAGDEKAAWTMAVSDTNAHRPTPAHPDPQGEPGETARQCTTEEVVETLQVLLLELKALVARQGGGAERLLFDLEQGLLLLPGLVSSRSFQVELSLALRPLRSENALLRRRVRILNQQLQERERAERDGRVRHSDSKVSALQVELGKLQDDLTETQRASRDVSGRLHETEVENCRIRTDLEATSSRLLESQRLHSEAVLLAQQRLEEIHTLQKHNSILPGHLSTPVPVSSSPSLPLLTKRALDQYQSGRGPSEPPLDPVRQYLSSLGQDGLAPGSQHHLHHQSWGPDDGCTSVSAEMADDDKQRSQMEAEKSSFSPLSWNPPGSSQDFTEVPNVLQLLHQSKPLFDPASHHLSQLGGRVGQGRDLLLDSSLLSTASSASTFNTRDEIEFQNGLEALDASIANLQRTIKMDLAR